jgi:hypothetical protein
VSRLTNERLDSRYAADGFGVKKTMRPKVNREIRRLRSEPAARADDDVRGPETT